MKRTLIAPMLLIFASYQAAAQGELPTDQAASSTRAYLGIKIESGALIGSVDNNGPAQAAGIERGDLIIRFDGKEIRNPAELSQIVADTPIGKEVMVAVVRGGQEGMTTLKLGQRLVLDGTALDAYRQKLNGMAQELESLGASKGSWTSGQLRAFSELYDRFAELKKIVPPEDGAVQNLWGQLEREFRVYKVFADQMVRQREAQRDQATAPEPSIEEQLGPLYVDYMTLQVCAARFDQLDGIRSGLREFLKSKEAAFPRELADRLWNAIAVKFQKVEGALERAGSDQLRAECEQAGNQATALITQKSGPAQDPPLRKKDF